MRAVQFAGIAAVALLIGRSTGPVLLALMLMLMVFGFRRGW